MTEVKTSEQKVAAVVTTTTENTKPSNSSVSVVVDTDVDTDDEDDKTPIWEFEDNGWKIVNKQINTFLETFYSEVVSQGVYPKKKVNKNLLKLGENSNQNTY